MPSSRPRCTTAAQLNSEWSTRKGSPSTATVAMPSLAATHPRQRRLAAVEQRTLVEQVVAGVGRQAQFGKGHQRRAALAAWCSSATLCSALKAGSATRQRGTATATRAKPWRYRLKKSAGSFKGALLGQALPRCGKPRRALAWADCEPARGGAGP